jgi:hypothetical protein
MKSLLVTLLALAAGAFFPQESRALTMDVACYVQPSPPSGRAGTYPNIVCNMSWAEGGSPLAHYAQASNSLCYWLNCTPTLHNIFVENMDLYQRASPYQVWILCNGVANREYQHSMGGYLKQLQFSSTGTYYATVSQDSDSQHVWIDHYTPCPFP